MDRGNRTSLGIILMAGFSIIAPGMDAMVKLIGDAVAVVQIVSVRFFAQAALLLPLAFAFGWLHWPSGGEIRLHLLRALLLFLATACFFTALRFLPLADAIAIFFVEPFVLTILGALLLGEQVGPRRYVACAIGFAGALLIIQPSFEEVGAAATLPLATALFFALYMIVTRRMATRMHPVTLQIYTGVAALAFSIPLLWLFDGSGVHALDPSWPEQREMKLLIAVGLFATASHVCISYALSLAPVTLIAPIQYLEIVTAATLGYYLFDDLPDLLTFAGIVLIVTSGLFVFLRERQLDRRAAAR